MNRCSSSKPVRAVCSRFPRVLLRIVYLSTHSIESLMPLWYVSDHGLQPLKRATCRNPTHRLCLVELRSMSRMLSANLPQTPERVYDKSIHSMRFRVCSYGTWVLCYFKVSSTCENAVTTNFGDSMFHCFRFRWQDSSPQTMINPSLNQMSLSESCRLSSRQRGISTLNPDLPGLISISLAYLSTDADSSKEIAASDWT